MNIQDLIIERKNQKLKELRNKYIEEQATKLAEEEFIEKESERLAQEEFNRTTNIENSSIKVEGSISKSESKQEPAPLNGNYKLYGRIDRNGEASVFILKEDLKYKNFKPSEQSKGRRFYDKNFSTKVEKYYKDNPNLFKTSTRSIESYKPILSGYVTFKNSGVIKSIANEIWLLDPKIKLDVSKNLNLQFEDDNEKYIAKQYKTITLKQEHLATIKKTDIIFQQDARLRNNAESFSDSVTFKNDKRQRRMGRLGEIAFARKYTNLGAQWINFDTDRNDNVNFDFKFNEKSIDIKTTDNINNGIRVNPSTLADLYIQVVMKDDGQSFHFYMTKFLPKNMIENCLKDKNYDGPFEDGKVIIRAYEDQITL